MTIDAQIAGVAAQYMGGEAWQIALTDNTTMCLAMVYSGLTLRPADEVLQTVHDHYSTDLSLQLRAERTGAVVRRVALYDDPASVSVDAVVKAMHSKGIIMSSTPYRNSYARFAPSLINNEQEIEHTVKVLAML